MDHSDNWFELSKKVNYLRTLGAGIETHMSWVFLTDEFAYKLKKPVYLPHLNLSTLAQSNKQKEGKERKYQPTIARNFEDW
jgi:aminoglycoside phosphotransferase family enzyme